MTTRQETDPTVAKVGRRVTLRDSWIAGALFLVCFSIFHYARVVQILDSKYITAVSHSLVTQGTLALPPDFGALRLPALPYQLQSVDGTTYHFFSNAPAVLNLPFVVAFEFSGVTPVAADGRFIRRNEVRILRFTAAFLSAALCAVLYLLARLSLNSGQALALASVFAFGTQIFSTLSRAYWSHTWAVLLLAIALYLLLSPRWNDRAWAHGLSATCLAWSYFCRPTMSLSIVGIAVFLFFTQRSRLPYFVGTGLVWAALFVVYSSIVFDSIVPPYFLSGHVESGRLGGEGLLQSYRAAALGTLVSPGRGLFVYVPVFGLILGVVLGRWRSLPSKGLAITALAVVVAHWQLVSSFRNWWGGQSFGPRLFSDLIVWFFVLAILAVAAAPGLPPSRRPRWRKTTALAVVLIVAASIFINTRGATSRATLRWGQKLQPRGIGRAARIEYFREHILWDWRYPQFMAGLIPPPRQTERPPAAGE